MSGATTRANESVSVNAAWVQSDLVERPAKEAKSGTIVKALVATAVCSFGFVSVVASVRSASAHAPAVVHAAGAEAPPAVVKNPATRDQLAALRESAGRFGDPKRDLEDDVPSPEAVDSMTRLLAAWEDLLPQVKRFTVNVEGGLSAYFFHERRPKSGPVKYCVLTAHSSGELAVFVSDRAASTLTAVDFPCTACGMQGAVDRIAFELS